MKVKEKVLKSYIDYYLGKEKCERSFEVLFILAKLV